MRTNHSLTRTRRRRKKTHLPHFSTFHCRSGALNTIHRLLRVDANSNYGRLVCSSVYRNQPSQPIFRALGGNYGLIAFSSALRRRRSRTYMDRDWPHGRATARRVFLAGTKRSPLLPAGLTGRVMKRTRSSSSPTQRTPLLPLLQTSTAERRKT